MKSRTSVPLRIRAICEYTILRNLMIMFFFLVAFSPAVLLTSRMYFADGVFKASEASIFDIGMHITVGIGDRIRCSLGG